MIFAIVLMLAQIPEPAKGDIERWLLSAAAVVAMAAMVKSFFKKEPPDHKQYADKRDTERRLNALERRQTEDKEELLRKLSSDKEELLRKMSADKEEVLQKLSRIPAETVVMIKQTKELLG